MERKIPKKYYKEQEVKNELKKLQTELGLPSIPKICDELVVDLEKYKSNNYCGLKIEHRFINNNKFKRSESQLRNDYFKYKSIGLLNEEKNVPEPKTLKNGTLNIEYKRLESQSINCKNLLDSMNLEIDKLNFQFTNPKYAGTIDVIALDNNIKTKVKNKKRVLIQLVTTGLLNDKYKSNGWHNETLADKNELTIKAIHLKMLAKYEFGIEDIPFYYFVFSNKNEWEYKAFEICVDKNTISQYYNSLKNVKYYLDEQINNWSALPLYKSCINCELNFTCHKSQDFAEINKIYI